ncbi:MULTISPECIES: hypothetical protein [unclassified Sphingomonas]|jgi:hypothetical protein|uniref:hypothetical protein n=1 Tax=unclassified Sphingomonas TaxID=196159 RepID=UPI000E103926|nr:MULTISPECIES: hypothetical protein [unclassified Sphingomonas]AXJ95928.1 hypothetical protein DM480_10815 [Sphingomonas sp. FARSPH]
MRPALANAALGMHVERASAQGQVQAEWTYGGPTAAPFECARLAARLGVRAWTVAADVRTEYDLPPFAPEHPFIDTLRRRVAEDEVRRWESIARTRAMFGTSQS